MQVLHLLIKFCPWLLYAYINTRVLGAFKCMNMKQRDTKKFFILQIEVVFKAF